MELFVNQTHRQFRLKKIYSCWEFMRNAGKLQKFNVLAIGLLVGDYCRSYWRFTSVFKHFYLNFLMHLDILWTTADWSWLSGLLLRRGEKFCKIEMSTLVWFTDKTVIVKQTGLAPSYLLYIQVLCSYYQNWWIW